MPIRWLRNTRSPRGEARAPEVPEQTTAVFLDLDNRQGIAQAAVAAAELDPDSPVERAWDEVAAQCTTPDAGEGMSAFLQKRKAAWTK